MANLKDKALLEQYHDPESPGSCGGIERFAKENGISLKRAKQILEKRFGLHVTQTASMQLSYTPCGGVWY